jgi:hypothetical protein
MAKKGNVRNKAQREKLRQAERPSGIREKISTMIHQTFLRKVQPIIAVFGVLATFFGIYYPISDALREPEIQHSVAQIDDPFSVRFSLHNPSVIFQMTGMRFTCVLLNIKRAEIPNLEGISVDDGIPATILAGKTIEYECPIEKALELDQVVQATIRIDATFRTFGYERTTQSEFFNWDIVTRQWTKGKIIN